MKKQTVHTTGSKRRKHKRRRKVNARNILTLLLIIAVVLEMIGATAGLVIIRGMLKDMPVLVVDDFISPESSHIYDKDGNQIADVGTQLRENITYDDMSESLIDAFVSVEDSRYFEHDGFDLPRFTKSVLESIKAKLTHSGGLQGGSTFTMQLVKLTYFQNDEAGTSSAKTIEYKVQQIALARNLETKTDKKTIFELYLNKMNFGGTGNIRGIQKAAEYYYGKSAGELNLSEAAMLAGVINSPYYYDPHNYLDRATSRRNTVLYLMLHHGYITKEEYNLAVSVKVEDTLIDPNNSSSSSGEKYAYQSYIDYAITEAEKITGQDPLVVAMDIYTYMDPIVQQEMDSIQSGEEEAVVFPDELMEIGIIAENNQTGEIVGIGGGRNYGRGGSMLLNHATSQFKQPGSTVKPFLDYALAFEYLGWSTSHVVTDRPIAYKGTNMVIKNANGQYNGQVTLSYATAASLNTPAIQALQEVIEKAGWTTVVNYLISCGFSQVSEDNFDIGFAIGGSNFICSAKELMAAQAIVMNGGNYIEPHAIKRIEYRNGMQEPYSPVYLPTNVLSPQAAFLTAQLMYDTIHAGVYNYLQILTRQYPTYGKTGTTDWGTSGLQYNIPQGASKDKWMVCQTTEYTIVTWVGYEKGVKDADTYFDSAKSQLNIPGNICSLVLDAVQHDSIPKAVEMPEGISKITHILGTFPYANPIDGMDPAFITEGYIKSDEANLVSPELGDLETLNSFTANYNNNGTIDLNWVAYPDPSKLSWADENMDISLYNSSGELLVEAYGKRLFDWSYVYGPVRYKVRIRQGDNVFELSSETEASNQAVDLLNDVQTEACGFYGYENGSASSNEICVTFRTPKVEKPAEKTPVETEQPGASNDENNNDSDETNENTNDTTGEETADPPADDNG